MIGTRLHTPYVFLWGSRLYKYSFSASEHSWRTSIQTSNLQAVKVNFVIHDPSTFLLTDVSTDVPEILAMIKELADYEHASTSVEATEESLTRTLTFADSTASTQPGFAKTLILRLPAIPSHPEDKPNAVAGMALYFNNYSTWRAKPGIYLEDLYVRPQYRKRGYGKALIQALAHEVLAMDGGRLEWSCLRWNEPSLQFYRSLGAKEQLEWVGLRVDGEALKKLALGQTQQFPILSLMSTGRTRCNCYPTSAHQQPVNSRICTAPAVTEYLNLRESDLTREQDTAVFYIFDRLESLSISI
nr:n-acetyltransferase ats1 [Quercus suber]POE94710.1 n-acetyltransferase ats1 [Quercus suber]